MNKLVWEDVPQASTGLYVRRARIPTGWVWVLRDLVNDEWIGTFFEPVVEFDPSVKVELPPPINK